MIVHTVVVVVWVKNMPEDGDAASYALGGRWIIVRRLLDPKEHIDTLITSLYRTVYVAEA